MAAFLHRAQELRHAVQWLHVAFVIDHQRGYGTFSVYSLGGWVDGLFQKKWGCCVSEISLKGVRVQWWSGGAGPPTLEDLWKDFQKRRTKVARLTPSLEHAAPWWPTLKTGLQKPHVLFIWTCRLKGTLQVLQLRIKANAGLSKDLFKGFRTKQFFRCTLWTFFGSDKEDNIIRDPVISKSQLFLWVYVTSA